jgi:CRP-like cAMP-binding protein
MEVIKSLFKLHGKEWELKKGESIFDKIGKFGSLIFIDKGMALKGHYHSGETIYTDIVGPQEFITLREFYTASVNVDFSHVLSENVIIYSMSIEHLKEIESKGVDIKKDLETLFDKEIKLYEYLYLDWSRCVAQERILKLLIRLDKKYGKNIGVERLIALGLTHTDLANLAQSSRQTVTTLFNKWREDNLINYDRKKILNRNIEKLKVALN